MKRRGVKNVYLMDLMRLEFPENYFDSILMMFNNFGLAGTIEGTKKVLKVLHRVSTDKGRIITTIRDPYKTDNPQHLAYHERNRREGRPAGQVKIRIEYKGEIGDWFDLLMVPPREELESLIKDVGWGILRIVRENGYYGAVLEKI
jgi:ubiquinone/menaquinone biosynthesis C-methylase UbiE